MFLILLFKLHKVGDEVKIELPIRISEPKIFLVNGRGSLYLMAFHKKEMEKNKHKGCKKRFMKSQNKLLTLVYDKYNKNILNDNDYQYR